MIQRLSPLWAFALLIACGTDQETTTPVVGPITEAVYASGLVRAKGQYEAHAMVSGILLNTFVQAGDTVKKGDPIFYIDDKTSALSTSNARLMLELARKNAAAGSPLLEQRRIDLARARERLVNDSSLYARQQQLWAQGIGSQNELEQRQLAYDNARNAHASARSALEDARLRVHNELELAKNNFSISEAARTEHTVASLIDGLVYDILIEPGELVSAQQPLAIIGSGKAFKLELNVDERDIAEIAVGQQVLFTMDSYADRVFKALVARIDPIMDQRSRTFTVHAELVDAPERLYPFLTVEANIVIREVTDALTIPTSYLVNGSHVLVGPEEQRTVRLGARDLQRVQVLEGLDAEQVIYRP